MKKGVITFSFILLVVFSMSFVSAEYICQGGVIDYSNKGSVTFTEGALVITAEDYCFDSPVNIEDGTKFSALGLIAFTNGFEVEEQPMGEYLLETTCASVTVNGVKDWHSSITYKCPNGCSDGGCIEETTCNDADQEDYFSKNEVSVQKGNFELGVEDLCLSDLEDLADQYTLYQTLLDNMVSEGVVSSSQLGNANLLIEAFCPSNVDYTLDAFMYQKAYDCQDGCSDGACIGGGNEASCTDEDNLDYFNEGETVIEKDGGSLTVSDMCLNDLKNLADQYPLYQTILDNMISGGVVNSDEVEDEAILIEGFCPSNIDHTLDSVVYQKSYKCPNGCSEGACVSEQDENSGSSNGRKSEVKILPEVASDKAREVLGDLDFTVELKEVGSGNNVREVYEVKGEKQGRFLGIFKIRGEVSAIIDSETGEVISQGKPWWAFLASGI